MTDEESSDATKENEPFKMLKKARLEGAPPLRNFEAMDHIHERMRNRTEEGLTKLEPIIRKNLHSLYYDKKANLYSLTQEKKRIDDLNIERLIKKTMVPTNLLTQQEDEVRALIKVYNIDIKNMSLPYYMKIKQICANMTAFFRYKRDQRETLDFSLMKSKEFIDAENEKFLDIKVFTKVDFFGESSLTPDESKRFENLM
jgi:hypothetical protein